jgi:pyridoxal phosphate enzyme (YggS family)
MGKHNLTVVQENITTFQGKLKNTGSTLVAVSKTKPLEDILAAYEVGQRDFGENKVQELVLKQKELPADIRWHMIGHLQRNKVKSIAPFVYLIHAVDSIRLLVEINKQAEKNNRIIKCLIQVHIAEEDTKFGFLPSELHDLFSNRQLELLKNIEIAGLMGMASNTSDQEQIKKEFQTIHSIFTKYRDLPAPNVHFSELSIGMSNDYELALANGSTLIRVGSAIFGPRIIH